MNGRRITIKRGERSIAAVVHEAGAAAPCVVACHGMFGSKEGEKYVAMGERFPPEGISVVRFDFSGCGESPGDLRRTTVGGRLADLDVVLEFVQGELRPSRLGLLGSSLGGYVALLRAARDPRVRAVVAMATPYDLREIVPQGEVDPEFWRDLERHDLTRVLPEVRVPLLLLHSESDEVVPFSHALRIHEAVAGSELRALRGADHRFSRPEHREAVVEDALHWFRKHLCDR